MARDYKLERLAKEAFLSIEKTPNECKKYLKPILDFSEYQGQEIDRFFDAIGLKDENISIDEAIKIVTSWKSN